MPNWFHLVTYGRWDSPTVSKVARDKKPKTCCPHRALAIRNSYPRFRHFKTEPVPLVGLAIDWTPLWHWYRHGLRQCGLVPTDPAGVETLAREGIDALAAFSTNSVRATSASILQFVNRQTTTPPCRGLPPAAAKCDPSAENFTLGHRTKVHRPATELFA
jgi:hypothetical protein